MKERLAASPEAQAGGCGTRLGPQPRSRWSIGLLVWCTLASATTGVADAERRGVDRSGTDGFRQLLQERRVVVAPLPHGGMLVGFGWDEFAPPDDEGTVDDPSGIWLVMPDGSSRWLRQEIGSASTLREMAASPGGSWLAVASHQNGEDDVLDIIRLPALLSSGLQDAAWRVAGSGWTITLDRWQDDNRLVVWSEALLSAPRDERGVIWDCLSGDEAAALIDHPAAYRIDTRSGGIEALTPLARRLSASHAVVACSRERQAISTGAVRGDGVAAWNARGDPPAGTLEQQLGLNGVRLLVVGRDLVLVAAGLPEDDYRDGPRDARAAFVRGGLLVPITGTFGCDQQCR